jgi:hypothetical protein
MPLAVSSTLPGDGWKRSQPELKTVPGPIVARLRACSGLTGEPPEGNWRPRLQRRRPELSNRERRDRGGLPAVARPSGLMHEALGRQPGSSRSPSSFMRRTQWFQPACKNPRPTSAGGRRPRPPERDHTCAFDESRHRWLSTTLDESDEYARAIRQAILADHGLSPRSGRSTAAPRSWSHSTCRRRAAARAHRGNGPCLGRSRRRRETGAFVINGDSEPMILPATPTCPPAWFRRPS